MKIGQIMKARGVDYQTARAIHAEAKRLARRHHQRSAPQVQSLSEAVIAHRRAGGTF